jgi:hypothetical protein
MGKANISTVPLDLESLIPDFLRRREHDITLIRTFITERNYAGIAIIGHKLRGNGAGYGFPRLTDLGNLIEEAAKNRDEEALKLHAHELFVTVSELKKRFS